MDRARRGEPPPPAALRGAQPGPARRPAIRRLAGDGVSVTARPHRTGPFGVRPAARLAESAADLLTDPAVTTVPECEADDCVMLFLPTHPRRRWCSPSRCGNRARAARYYQRHKAT